MCKSSLTVAQEKQMSADGLFSLEVSWDPVDYSSIPFSSVCLSGIHLSVDQTLCKPCLLCHCLRVWNFLLVCSGTPLENPNTLEKEKKPEKDSMSGLQISSCLQSYVEQ